MNIGLLVLLRDIIRFVTGVNMVEAVAVVVVGVLVMVIVVAVAVAAVLLLPIVPVDRVVVWVPVLVPRLGAWQLSTTTTTTVAKNDIVTEMLQIYTRPNIGMASSEAKVNVAAAMLRMALLEVMAVGKS